jgi:hypothetical protein
MDDATPTPGQSRSPSYWARWEKATGGLPAPCAFCGEPVTDRMFNGSRRSGAGGRSAVIHHLDGNHSNNAVENLAVAHHACHTRHHAGLPPEGDPKSIGSAERFALVPENVVLAPISDGAVRVYALLRRYSDRDGGAWPSRRRMAAQLRISRGTLDRRLAELVEAEFLVVEARYRNGARTTNLYRFPWTGGGSTGGATPARTASQGGSTGGAQNENHLTSATRSSTGSTARGADPQEDANGDRPEWSRAALAALDAREAALDAREAAGSGVPDPSGNVQSHG